MTAAPSRRHIGARGDTIAPTPRVLHAERAVLGALLLDADGQRVRSTGLTESSFATKRNALVYRAVATLAERGEPCDFGAVVAWLEQQGIAALAGGREYLAELTDAAASAGTYPAYLRTLREAEQRRELARAAQEIAERVADPEATVAELAPFALAAFGSVADASLADAARCATLAEWWREPPETRGEIVARIVPAGVVTLAAGHGGAGKSVLTCAMLAHVACGRPFASLPVRCGPVLLVSLEDPAAVVASRLHRICDAYSLPRLEVAERFRIVDATASGPLATEVAAGGVRVVQFAALLDRIDRLAEGCAVVAIDNASDAADLDENNRRQVRAFMRRLGKIAARVDCGLVLVAHIDKNAARFGSNGNSYSGSTAWHNSARSRVALEPADGRVTLRHEKANYGPRVDDIAFRWTDDGVLVPVLAGDPDAEHAQRVVESADDVAVLNALRAAIASGASVTTARVGSCTTLHALKTFPDLPANLRSASGRSAFWDALARLQRAGFIAQETYRDAQRKDRTRWRIVNGCAE